MADVVGTGLSFWLETENTDWDTLVLGGTVWPGIWEMRGEGVGRKIDLKKSKGQDKATLKDEGYKNAKFSAIGTIWTAEQWRDLQAILPEVHPRKAGGDRKALQIIHPQINVLGIDSVYLRGIKVPEMDKEKGGPLTVVLDFIEWTAKPKKPKNAPGGGSGNCGPKHDAAQLRADLAAINLSVAQGAYAADPTPGGDAQIALILAEQESAFAQADLVMTPCSSSGNQSGSESEGKKTLESTTVDDTNDGLNDEGEGNTTETMSKNGVSGWT